jgi:hypothetical protein
MPDAADQCQMLGRVGGSGPATVRRTQAEEEGMRVLLDVPGHENSRCRQLDADGLPSFCMQERDGGAGRAGHISR